jgi:hypothetical protein
LNSPIKRVFYLSKEGTDREHEVQLPANSQVLHGIRDAGAVVYGVGSLYTSIVPSLVLQVCPVSNVPPSLPACCHQSRAASCRAGATWLSRAAYTEW